MELDTVGYNTLIKAMLEAGTTDQILINSSWSLWYREPTLISLLSQVNYNVHQKFMSGCIPQVFLVRFRHTTQWSGKLIQSSFLMLKTRVSWSSCKIPAILVGWCSVYGRGLQLDKAIEIFSNARRSGLYLDEKIYTNMIMHYGKAGMYLIEIFILMFCMWYESQFLADMECSVTLTGLDSG